jgi:hypothetical protein
MSNNKFLEYVEKYINPINIKLEKILESYSEDLQNKSNIGLEYFKVFANSSYGGKRLRAILTLLRI